MKITILEKEPGEENEIIVKCDYLDEELIQLLNRFKTGKTKMSFYKDSQIIFLDPKDIIYFESVDDNVFAYTKDSVYESRLKLYMLEEELYEKDFFRASKAVILNLNKVQSLAPAFGGRFEATLTNGYKIIISRNYVAKLKEILGLQFEGGQL